MPFLTAQKIHNGHHWLPEGTVIEVADDGTIVSLRNDAPAGTIHYDGILAPGFVNAHCHLELSHMKGLAPEHTGLIPFLKTIPLHRNDFTDEQKKTARHNGYNELVENGTVAIGDISNTTDTLDIRALDQLHYHTFVESFGFNDAHAPFAFDYALGVYNTLAAQAAGTLQRRQSITPHAPYSVSSSLFKLIDAHTSGSLISIHNQETREEDKYYISKEGTVPELLQILGIDDSLFTPTGRSSLHSYLDWLSSSHPFVFIHNTYTGREHVQYAHSRIKHAYWCLCPNANLYIENTLPDIDMFISEGAQMCIGTDSLASNHKLSILSELQSIKQHYPHISWETLLTWATRNGAHALQMQDIIGTIEVGKKPGIIQITGIDDAIENQQVKRVI